jgi:hypothetical protein
MSFAAARGNFWHTRRPLGDSANETVSLGFIAFESKIWPIHARLSRDFRATGGVLCVVIRFVLRYSRL